MTVLSFSDRGAGSALVFLHGFCEDARIWDDFAAPFGEKYRIICIDLPGFGRSPAAPGISIAGMAEAVKGTLDELKISEMTLIGHSMGGYVALEYASRWPENLRALGLFHSQPYADSEEKKEARLKSADFVRRHGSLPFVAQLIPGLFAPAFARENPAIVQELVQRAAAYDPEGIAAALEAMRNRSDLSAILQNAIFPVLFLIGTEDQAIPAELSKRQTTLPPVASIHYLPGVGHMGMLEAREATQNILDAFLDEINNRNALHP
jgi:pimeloyl-ACP methyl ester carboxylesterase